MLSPQFRADKLNDMTALNHSSKVNHQNDQVTRKQRRVEAKAPRRFSVIAPQHVHVNVFWTKKGSPPHGRKRPYKQQRNLMCNGERKKALNNEDMDQVILRMANTAI